MDIVERLRDMQAKKYRSDWAHWVQTQCSAAAAEIEQLRAEVDDLRTRLVQKMDDCVTAEQRQKKDADTYWIARESLVARIETLHETLQGIAAADWREWQELASAEEFVRWAKSRARNVLTNNTHCGGLVDRWAGFFGERHGNESTNETRAGRQQRRESDGPAGWQDL